MFVVLVGCSSYRQGPRAVSQAKSLGFKVILLDTENKLSLVPELQSHFDLVIAVETLSLEDCLKQLKAQVDDDKIVGFYTFEEFSVAVCAQLAEEYGLPGNSTDSIKAIRNKFRCREILSAAGLRQPSSHLCRNLSEAKHLITSQAGCWVIKPIDSAGSQGVSVVDSHDDTAINLAFNTLQPTQQELFIVEEYVSGHEYSIEGYFSDGSPVIVGITAKQTTKCIEMMHSFPANLGSELEQRVFDQVHHALKSVGLKFGNFHVECWIDVEEEIIVGEVHARPGGDYIHLLTELATGIETYREVLVQLLDCIPFTQKSSQPAKKYAVVKFFPQPTAGRVSSIEGYEKVQGEPDVHLIELTAKVGDIVHNLTESSQRVGCIVLIGDELNNLERKAHEIANRVHFNTE